VTLADAVSGVDGDGPLYATFQTSQGDVHCWLDEVRAPELVAHFVGLVRGVRAWRKPDGPWQHAPFYDGLSVHRALPGIWAVTGDPLGSGPGGAGFHIADVLKPELRHDKPGVLSLVTLGQANTASSQVGFFARAAPWADDVHLPFGLCEDLAVIDALSRQPPRSQVVQRVTVHRMTVRRGRPGPGAPVGSR
jgi:cyclophilin family peptidyl-prolyl cis-trans isomerase